MYIFAAPESCSCGRIRQAGKTTPTKITMCSRLLSFCVLLVVAVPATAVRVEGVVADDAVSDSAVRSFRRRQPAPTDLDEDVLAQIDAHTSVDAQVFAKALRLLLGRLRTVEEESGVSLLACIDWAKLHEATGHIPGLWSGPDELAV